MTVLVMRATVCFVNEFERDRLYVTAIYETNARKLTIKSSAPEDGGENTLIWHGLEMEFTQGFGVTLSFLGQTLLFTPLEIMVDENLIGGQNIKDLLV